MAIHHPRSLTVAMAIMLIFAFGTQAAFAQRPKAAPNAPRPAVKDTQIPPPGPAERPLGEEREYTDSRSDIDLTVPAGWLVFEVAQRQKTDPAVTMIEGPGAPAPSCRFTVRKPKQPEKITQAMINKIMHDKRNIDNITKNVGSAGRKVIAVNKTTNNGVNGIEARVMVPGTARRPDVTILVNFYEVVGRAYSFECSILSADYENMASDINAMIKSVRFSKS